MLIAIDGGGTKTEIVVFEESGRIVGRQVDGACNPSVFSFESCASRLAEVLRTMGVAMDSGTRIYIGTAGIFTETDGPRFAELVSRLCNGVVVKCENDAMNVMASASDGGNCVAGVCGTGSIAFARSPNGVRRFGGIGHLLDGDGSGYGIGAAAIRHLMCDRDRGVFSSLSRRLLAEVPSNDYAAAADKLVLEVYRNGPGFVAGFARAVFEAMRAGDEDALLLLKANVRAFARLLERAAAWADGAKLAVVSGGIAAQPEFLNLLRQELGGKMEVVVPAYPQIIGACLNCVALAGLGGEDIKGRIVDSYRKLTKEKDNA